MAAPKRKRTRPATRAGRTTPWDGPEWEPDSDAFRSALHAERRALFERPPHPVETNLAVAFLRLIGLDPADEDDAQWLADAENLGPMCFLWHDPAEPIATTRMWGAALDLIDTYLTFAMSVRSGRLIYGAWKKREDPPPELQRMRALARSHVRSPSDDQLRVIELVEQCARRFHAGEQLQAVACLVLRVPFCMRAMNLPKTATSSEREEHHAHFTRARARGPHAFTLLTQPLIPPRDVAKQLAKLAPGKTRTGAPSVAAHLLMKLGVLNEVESGTDALRKTVSRRRAKAAPRPPRTRT